MINLQKTIASFNGKSYKLYKSLKNTYQFNTFTLKFLKIQSDPFAPPSIIRITTNTKIWGIQKEEINNNFNRITLADYINRVLYRYTNLFSTHLGSGKSGIISIQKPSQEILQRTSVIIEKDGTVLINLKIGLPANGRRINSNAFEKIFFENIPSLIHKASNSTDRDIMDKWVTVINDFYFIQNKLQEMGIVSFIANNSILPRMSGTDPRPKRTNAIKFQSPQSMEISINLPDNRKITGMGIKKGITLITGGGFHGKSTLMKAIQLGIYPHIPSDGREYCVTIPNAIKIKAEEGRNINNVNISYFINNIPGYTDTTNFSTQNASGSTSQAASIMESIEIGSKLLLIDEDTSATNFMIRDKRMQELIDNEPIIPFIDRCSEIYKKYDISSIIITGGSGDYLDVANTILMMDNYSCKDITKKAFIIKEKYPLKRKYENIPPFILPKKRIFEKKLFFQKYKPLSTDYILLNKEKISLNSNEQITESAQLSFIIKILQQISQNPKHTKTPIIEILNDIYDKNILNIFNSPTELSFIRKEDVFYTINRIPFLQIYKKNS